MDIQKRPLIGISVGDPAGVGPEICVKSLTDPEMGRICRPVIVGHAGCLRDAAERVCRLPVTIRAVQTLDEARFEQGQVNVLEAGSLPAGICSSGQISAAAGRLAYDAVARLIRLALDGDVAATVTAPINKEALRLAGCKHAGHTEIYADLTGTSRYTMLLAHDRLRIVHVSTHVSLLEACARVKRDRVLDVIRLAWSGCRQLGIGSPRVAVAGLNPHAGENGLFGREEIETIGPAIQDARQLGIDATGPWPPDTVFARAAAGHFDVVVAMYHDQGHIPMKMAGFDFAGGGSLRGINMTLGLPIVRVSVDHGTAFNIAGQNKASPDSLKDAIRLAAILAAGRPASGAI